MTTNSRWGRLVPPLLIVKTLIVSTSNVRPYVVIRSARNHLSSLLIRSYIQAEQSEGGTIH